MADPREKPLQTTSFVVHATRGIIRDQNTRRWMMFGTILVALLLVFAGSTFFQGFLRTHPGWFILYWFVVGWLALTAILLALFDLLVVRAQARAAKRILRDDISASERSKIVGEADDA